MAKAKNERYQWSMVGMVMRDTPTVGESGDPDAHFTSDGLDGNRTGNRSNSEQKNMMKTKVEY